MTLGAQSAIFPVPDINKVPLSYSVQVRLSPCAPNRPETITLPNVVVVVMVDVDVIVVIVRDVVVVVIVVGFVEVDVVVVDVIVKLVVVSVFESSETKLKLYFSA